MCRFPFFLQSLQRSKETQEMPRHNVFRTVHAFILQYGTRRFSDEVASGIRRAVLQLICIATGRRREATKPTINSVPLVTPYTPASSLESTPRRPLQDGTGYVQLPK